MDARAKTATSANAREIVVTRDYDQPREAVFQAWTNAEQLKRWWAPAGCTTPHCTVDFRPGGKFHYCMRLPDGRDIWGLGIYREIVVPERIVYVDSFADADGTPVPPSHYFMSAEQPERSLVTVTFSENVGRTTLTLHHAIGPEVKEREQIRQGWNEMLDRLADDFAKA